MQKDDLVYVGHMLDMTRKGLEKMRSKSRLAYEQDENLRLALAYLLQIIGEAASHVSQPFQRAHPGIPWRQIIGMRHKIVHDYLYVDYDIVWGVATVDLPVLLVELEKIVPPEETEDMKTP